MSYKIHIGRKDVHQRQSANNNPANMDGTNEWVFTFKFHEIGTNRQRSNSKFFSGQEEAKRFFEERATHLCNSMERLADASFQRGESELVITRNGNPVAYMAYLPIAHQCA